MRCSGRAKTACRLTRTLGLCKAYHDRDEFDDDMKWRSYAITAAFFLFALSGCNGRELAWYEPILEPNSGLTWSACAPGEARCGLTYGEISLDIDPYCCEEFVRLFPLPIDIP